MNSRAHALADRLARGADALAAFASDLSDTEWKARIPNDNRTVGVVVHHVATVYPVELELAQALADGNMIMGVTWNVIHEMNAAHARAHEGATKESTLTLLRNNSTAAAEGVRALTDAQLDRAALVSLYADAPLTCQFMLEDHVVRHSYHHLAAIQAAVGRQTPVHTPSSATR
jgi:hypothetical protein